MLWQLFECVWGKDMLSFRQWVVGAVALALFVGLCAMAQPGEEPCRWAVIIGINNYEDKNVQDLRYAVPDATSLFEVLTAPETGGFDPAKAKLLTDKSGTPPTRRNILRALGGLESAPRRDDTVLVYFSGHGFTEKGENYLLPRDGELGLLEDTGVSLKRFMISLKRCVAKRQIIILDCCHSGVDRARGLGNAMTEEVAHRVFEEAEGRIVLSSCDLHEVAYEWEDKGHGVFTYYLLKALRGYADRDNDYRITADEAFTYTTGKVREWAFQNNCRQNPRREYYRVTGDIVLSRRPKALRDLAVEPTRPAAESRVSMAFNRTDLNAVLRVLASQFEVEITAPDVGAQRISLELENATLEQALELICGQADLSWDKEGEVYKVHKGRASEKVQPASTAPETQETATVLPPPAQTATTASLPSTTAQPATSPGSSAPRAAKPPRGRRRGQTWTCPTDGSEMVWTGKAWIDRRPVSIAQYRRFCEATGRRMPKRQRSGPPERTPVTYVSGSDAGLYALWAGKRLPTPEELEDAVKGGPGRQPVAEYTGTGLSEWTKDLTTIVYLRDGGNNRAGQYHGGTGADSRDAFRCACIKPGEKLPRIQMPGQQAIAENAPRFRATREAVELTWPPPIGKAVSWEVRRGITKWGEPAPKLSSAQPARVSEPRFVDTDIREGRVFVYEVTAVWADGTKEPMYRFRVPVGAQQGEFAIDWHTSIAFAEETRMGKEAGDFWYYNSAGGSTSMGLASPMPSMIELAGTPFSTAVGREAELRTKVRSEGKLRISLHIDDAPCTFCMSTREGGFAVVEWTRLQESGRGGWTDKLHWHRFVWWPPEDWQAIGSRIFEVADAPSAGKTSMSPSRAAPGRSGRSGWRGAPGSIRVLPR